MWKAIAFPPQSQGNPVFYRTQNYRRLMLGCLNGKNGWETSEKRQRIVLKILVKQRKMGGLRPKREGWNLCWYPKNILFLSNLCISQFQLRPAPSRATAGHSVARLVSPGGWAFANFALSGGRAFANPGANPELLTRTQFPVRIQLDKGFYWKNKRIGSFVKEAKQLKRFVKACFAFLHCYQARITWRNRELSTWINGYWIKFLLSIIWRTSFHIFKTIHNS